MVGWLEQQLADTSSAEARAWLDAARAEIAREPAAIRRLFPAAGRHVGRASLGEDDDPWSWTVDDAARALLLAAHPDPASEIDELYRHGDTRERRAILRAVGMLDIDATHLLLDALRTNDTDLIAAALSNARALGDDDLAQAVLKCVFVGLDITRIQGLNERVTPHLSRMLADFAHERIAAGRTVPAQVWPLIERYPPADRLEAIERELDSPVAERRDAARAALAERKG